MNKKITPSDLLKGMFNLFPNKYSHLTIPSSFPPSFNEHVKYLFGCHPFDYLEEINTLITILYSKSFYYACCYCSFISKKGFSPKIACDFLFMCLNPYLQEYLKNMFDLIYHEDEANYNEIYLKDIDVLSKFLLNNYEDKIKDLENQLYYAPNNTGYVEAKNDFEIHTIQTPLELKKID